MKKSINDVKWFARKPQGSNGFWIVETSSRFEICSCFAASSADKRAKQIASDHNEMLKVKKALAKTPFKN